MEITFNRRWPWHPKDRPGRMFEAEETTGLVDDQTAEDLIARGVARPANPAAPDGAADMED